MEKVAVSSTLAGSLKHSITASGSPTTKTSKHRDQTLLFFFRNTEQQSRRAGPQGSRKNKKLLGFRDCLCTRFIPYGLELEPTVQGAKRNHDTKRWCVTISSHSKNNFKCLAETWEKGSFSEIQK